VDRTAGPTGYCRTDAGYAIAAITVHRGEEPVLSGANGICNVFFGHCNLRCHYCQNFQISRNESRIRYGDWSLEQVVDAVCATFERGINRLGFVSPSHMALQLIDIVSAVRQRGYRPVVVYNSNGYDRVATLQMLEEWVDVYLPDCKYSDPELGAEWSGVRDYPQVAAAALKEMYRQKGNLLHLDDDGLVTRGLIVRHLVLPGAVENSLGVLRFLAENLSSKVALSLMSQYQPIPGTTGTAPLHRQVTPAEYGEVVAAMERLGFCQGWIQESSSASYYNPDFSSDTPFE